MVKQVKQPSWMLSKELYSDDKIGSAYKSYMLKLAQMLAVTPNANKNVRQEVDKMFEIEKDLALVRKKMSEENSLTQISQHKLMLFAF